MYSWKKVGPQMEPWGFTWDLNCNKAWSYKKEEKTKLKRKAD